MLSKFLDQTEVNFKEGQEIYKAKKANLSTQHLRKFSVMASLSVMANVKIIFVGPLVAA